MRYLTLSDNLIVPQIVLGCMRINSLSVDEATTLLETALEEGINFFDHADIYGNGRSEELFAEAFAKTSVRREDIILQSKCGISRGGMYDFSKAHILSAVDGILGRLRTEYLDVLLLHRPDALMEPEEIAEAFSLLHETGKVRHFGVSNFNPMQMELLQQSLDAPLFFNQLQLSIMHTPMIDAGLNVNTASKPSLDHDGGILDYCRLHKVTIQPWSPFQHGFFGGVFLDNAEFPALNAVLDRIASERGVTNTAVALAWLLRHPANLQPILGTTKPERVRDCARATTFTLTREEWYEIYRAAGNRIL